MDLFLNVLGGFLAAVAFAGAGSAWRYARRPIYIPFEEKNWSRETRALLKQAGIDDAGKDVMWVINYELDDYEARGARTVRVRTGILAREVLAARKEGHAVLMTHPTR